jgi:type VI secretion system protein ImpB
MAESLQHKLDRVRRPRVQITYDVETGGAMKKVELPFVVGVLADLSGQPRQALKPLKERKAVYLDRDNFNDVLAKAGPRLALRVPNTLTDPNTKLAVELNFKQMDDFEPAKVAEQIGPLKQLLDMRHELIQLLNRMEGNDKLEQLLESILTNQQKAAALEKYMVSQAPPAPAAAPTPVSPQEEAAEEPTTDLSQEAGAEEPPPTPPPAKAAGGDPDREALLASVDSSGNSEGTASEPAAAAPATAPQAKEPA